MNSIALHMPGSERFRRALRKILGVEPPSWLEAALPYSAIAENCCGEPIALIGIRFDLTRKTGKKISVIHVADTLRNPETTEFVPGALRFFCAEPEYAAAVMRGDADVSARAKMNLQNLRTMLSVEASVDCLAFGDGRFDGPDAGGAFERFTNQRASEQALISALLSDDIRHEDLAEELNSKNSARRALAAGLMDAFTAAGRDAMLDYARKYRCRIALVRPGSEPEYNIADEGGRK